MAIEALQTMKKMSCRRTTKLYNIPQSILYNRINGRPPRLNIRPNYHKLTNLEEIVIVQYILNIDIRGFTPN